MVPAGPFNLPYLYLGSLGFDEIDDLKSFWLPPVLDLEGVVVG
jgi:hypothetical protein